MKLHFDDSCALHEQDEVGAGSFRTRVSERSHDFGAHHAPRAGSSFINSNFATVKSMDRVQVLETGHQKMMSAQIKINCNTETK